MSRIWRTQLIFVITSILLFGIYQTSSAQEQTLTLEQVIQIALERNPVIAVSRQALAASEARVLQARSGYLPQISSSANVSRNRVWTILSGSDGVHTESDYYGADVNLNQYLYDFGKTRKRLEASRHALDTGSRNLDQTIADVVLATQVNYYEVLKKKAIVKVNRDSLDTQQKHLEEARAFYSAGLRPKIDVIRGEVQYANTHLNLIRSRYDLSIAQTELENNLGGPPVQGPYVLADVSVEPQKVGLTDALIQKAMEKRPAIDALKAQIKAAQANLNAIQAEKWPSLNGNASYGYNNTDFPLEDEWSVGVHLDWPLFTGFRTKGQILEAQAEVEQLKSQLKRLELDVVRETTQAVSSVNETLESIKTAQLAVKQAEENMELAQGRYKVGVGSAIEYSDAELSLNQTRSNLVQAQFSYLQAQANLEHAIGKSFSAPPAQSENNKIQGADDQ